MCRVRLAYPRTGQGAKGGKLDERHHDCFIAMSFTMDSSPVLAAAARESIRAMMSFCIVR